MPYYDTIAQELPCQIVELTEKECSNQCEREVKVDGFSLRVCIDHYEEALVIAAQIREMNRLLTAPFRES